MFHAAEAGVTVSILEQFVLQCTRSRKLVVYWHIVGIIERRRFVFQVEIDFCVAVGSLGSKPTI